MATKGTTTKAAVAKLSTRNLIMASLVVSVVSVVAMVFVGRILVNQMTLNARVAGKKSAANAQAAKNLDALKQLESTYNSLGFTKDAITHGLPTKPDMPALAAMMENIASTSGVTMSALSQKVLTDAPAAPGNSPQNFDITMQVQGSYAALQTYIKNMEVSVRPLRVTAITFTGSNDAVQATFEVTSYYQGKADIETGTEVVQ